MRRTNFLSLNWSFISGFLLASSIYTLYTVINLPTTSSIRRKKVLLFGDSITQHGWNSEIKGWVAALGHYWFRRVDILNRGYSGYNSRWGLSLVDQVVIKERPDFVTVFFGANDAVDISVLQHVPIAEYESNMKGILMKIKNKLPSIPIVVITPPPIWEITLEAMNKMKQKALLLDRTNQRTYQYAQTAKKVATELSMPYLDLWEGLEGASDNRQLYLSDGLHLSAMGNQRLFELLVALIGKNYPEYIVENMQMDQPEWALMGEKFSNKHN